MSTYLTDSQITAIHDVPYLRNSMYRGLEIEGTLDYMRRRFVKPIAERIDVYSATLADCACGFGWLSFAFLLSGGRKAVLIDPDELRLEAAQQIARILNLDDRCEFMCTVLEKADLAENSIDIFATIETLEHVNPKDIASCISVIKTAARSIVVLTTPNKLFPIVSHDTRLPLAHWLPPLLRKKYARLFRREHLDYGNNFLSAIDLAPLSKKFRPDSAYQTFSTSAEFEAFYPHYLPYGHNASARTRQRPGKLQRMFVKTAGAVLGTWSFVISPNLVSIWVRRP